MRGMPEPGRKTGKYGRFHDQASVERAVLALGSRQHAVLRLDQLSALGLSLDAVRKRAAAGRLHRVHTAVYSLVPRALLTREGHWMAAVLACGDGAVISHRTAADLLGLRPTSRARIEVTIPGRSRRGPKGIDVHRSTTLTEADTTLERGIPCTTVARTALDLASVSPRRVVERALDQAEVMGVFDLIALDDQLSRNPNHPGTPPLRSVLNQHYVGSTLTQSELEEALLALCRRIGVRPPKVNRWIDLGDGGPMIWADFVWFEHRVIVETDGARYHGTQQARERDPRRDQRAIVAGWRPVRTTGRQVKWRPRELEATLLALLREPLSAAAG
jgi:very-short-patch-repair endonuclease